MNIQAYLVINSHGSLRIVKQRPYLNNNDIAVRLNIDVPKQFFDRMIPVVDIKLPDEALIKPDIETIVSITSEEIAGKLQLNVNDVADGLRDLLNKRESEETT